MKRIFFAALAAGMLASSATFAQTKAPQQKIQQQAQTTVACPKANTENPQSNATCPASPNNGKKLRYGAHDMMAPFEGLDLTEQQRQSIERINNEYMQKVRSQNADRRKINKANSRQDKKAASPQTRQMKEARQAQRAEYLNKIKTVLTPEQYTKFLENYSTMSDRPHPMRPGARPARNKTDRPQKAPKTTAPTVAVEEVE